MSAPPGEPAAAGLRERIIEHPMSPYYLIAGSASLLLTLGLIMVLSSSSIASYDVHGSAFTLFMRQALFAGVGVVAMFVVARMQIPTVRRLVLAFLIVTIVLLLLVFVPGIGVEVYGQRNWIRLVGPFQLQPSEFAKLALILWSAHLFARKDRVLHHWRHLAWPFLPVAAGVVLLVVAERDLGTAIILSIIVAALLFVAGAPLWVFGALGAVVVSGVAALSMAAAYRIQRFTAWLDPEADLDGAGWQLMQGKYALGTGGWWGVGLGGSREKWGALPAAHTDFIYPVIGEELGLFGALTVLGLFAAITVFALRIAVRTPDPFVRISAVGIIAWLVGQAMINLGAVLQLLPITGVPLPFVSYGGSSLIPSLMAIGILLAFARHEALRDAPPVEESKGRTRRRSGPGAARTRAGTGRAGASRSGAARPAAAAGRRRGGPA